MNILLPSQKSRNQFGQKTGHWNLLTKAQQKFFFRFGTTSIYNRALYEYSREYELNGKKFLPKNIFGIEICFRNEIIDKTHLTE
jgi:phenylalanyl-tRNA synthetase alpha subunit